MRAPTVAAPGIVKAWSARARGAYVLPLMLMLVGTAWGQDTTVVLAGRLLDPATGVTSTNQEILIVGGKIVAVGSPRTGDANRHVIDLSRYTVLPGLIDAHVHLAIGGTARANARADLRAGFTTVVDLGARTTRLLRIRDSINVGLIEGPRVLGAGIWIGTKGGVCEFNGIGIEGGPESFVARVHENVAAGADVVKACISGWPAEAFAKPESVQMNDETIAAIVRASHAAKRLVIAHDISLAGVKAALRAGVDGLAHAAYVDSATADDMRARGMFMIPTLASLTGGDSSAASRALIASTATAYRAGVTMVFGTDGGVLPHGDNAVEFLALRAAGLTALDAIRAATSTAARALNLADSLGAIKPAMSADIVAVDGDPLVDLHALARMRLVMLRGRTVVVPQPQTP